jgi:hypothetical protein
MDGVDPADAVDHALPSGLPATASSASAATARGSSSA